MPLSTAFFHTRRNLRRAATATSTAETHDDDRGLPRAAALRLRVRRIGVIGFVASTYAPEETQTVNAHGNREMPLSSPRRMLETLAEGLLPTIILG